MGTFFGLAAHATSVAKSHAISRPKHNFPKILFFIYLSFLRGSDNLYGDFLYIPILK